MDFNLVFRVLTIFVMVGFLPVCAYAYIAYRIEQRKLEIGRILDVLEISKKYRKIYQQDIDCRHYVLAVVFTMAVTAGGLSTLLLADELKLSSEPNLLLAGMRVNEVNVAGAGKTAIDTNSGETRVSASDSEGYKDNKHLVAYQRGALLVVGFAFLGAYVWGLQGIFRRYSMNDLLPITFYHFGLRMILASLIALLIYHALGGFSEATDESTVTAAAASPVTATDALLGLFQPTKDGILIVTAFLVGMFPQQGIRLLRDKISLIREHGHPSVRNLPLSMIEGMTNYDIFRLEELGIDTCYDLANSDFIPLLLKTSYGARELIDWILQAKLCVRFGEATGEMRARGIRLITDLEEQDEDFLKTLATETPVTLPSLKHTSEISVSDTNIARLKRAAELLGRYWEGDDEDEANKKIK